MCSMTTGQCPSNQIAPYQFNSHYDCVLNGYGVAQQTFKNLQAYEEYQKDVIEKDKLVIKFECRPIGEKT